MARQPLKLKTTAEGRVVPHDRLGLKSKAHFGKQEFDPHQVGGIHFAGKHYGDSTFTKIA